MRGLWEADHKGSSEKIGSLSVHLFNKGRVPYYVEDLKRGGACSKGRVLYYVEDPKRGALCRELPTKLRWMLLNPKP